MHQGAFKLVALLTGLALASSGIAPAHAALGGDAASVRADADELHGAIRTTAMPPYDIEEISTDSNIRVREYIDRNGIVFAVAWSGPVTPNLRTLLGSSFAAYADGLAASQPRMRRSVSVATADLVVESGGHMRAYAGRAFIPALIPPGTTTNELR